MCHSNVHVWNLLFRGAFPNFDTLDTLRTNLILSAPKVLKLYQSICLQRNRSLIVFSCLPLSQSSLFVLPHPLSLSLFLSVIDLPLHQSIPFVHQSFPYVVRNNSMSICFSLQILFPSLSLQILSPSFSLSKFFSIYLSISLSGIVTDTNNVLTEEPRQSRALVSKPFSIQTASHRLG